MRKQLRTIHRSGDEYSPTLRDRTKHFYSVAAVIKAIANKTIFQQPASHFYPAKIILEILYVFLNQFLETFFEIYPGVFAHLFIKRWEVISASAILFFQEDNSATVFRSRVGSQITKKHFFRVHTNISFSLYCFL